MADFTKQAIELISRTESAKAPYRNDITKEELATVQLEIDLLNSQWRDNSTQNGALDKIIPMVD